MDDLAKLRQLTDKQSATSWLQQWIINQKWQIVESNLHKPWGAYYRLSDPQAARFVKQYFSQTTLPDWVLDLPLTPKFLLVSPNKRLSWQYHDRRGELWKVLLGPVGVVRSPTDQMPPQPEVFSDSALVEIPPSSRHRLIGLKQWGVVAEIWVHSDPDNPSDEADNHRLQDDYHRGDDPRK